MFCKKCGKDIDIKNTVCPLCGEETDFLKGIDGSGAPEHLEAFEKEINSAFNRRVSDKPKEEVDYEDISAYSTTQEEREIRSQSRWERTSQRKNKLSTYFSNNEDDNSRTWKLLAGGCCAVILICLIIIMAVSCGGGSESDVPAPTTTVPVTTQAPTTETTTVPTTEKSIDEYLETAVVNDQTAVETAQGFYSNLESACAKGDYETFKSYFSSSYTDDEIKAIYDQNQATCASYTAFIPGYTQTVSCEKYIYVYIAATTDLTTGNYVENTFVLSSDGGAFKLDDKSSGGADWLVKAPTKLS
ncbi:MAG: hypothetical protein PUE67_06960 [Oscillospiraceae bacterium]|nr:hypothetical protein [Oscillospiraceae bacterium]